MADQERTHGVQLAPLEAAQLYRRCDSKAFDFDSTEQIAPIEGLIGQDRALKPIEFGSAIESHGFNLFLLGPPGTGKHKAALSYLKRRAAKEQTPRDWVYVNNFETPHRPVAIDLPAGIGPKLRDAMARLIDDLRTAIPAIFESEEYQVRRRSIEDAFREHQESALTKLRDEAGEQNIALLRTPTGFAMAPMADGKVLEPEAFNKLDEAERKEVERKITTLQEKLALILQSIPKQEKDRREQVRALNQEIAQVAVSLNMRDLEQAFADHEAVASYLVAVREDLIKNVAIFLMPLQGQSDDAPVVSDDLPTEAEAFDRYRVNVLVSQGGADSERQGAPVIHQNHPTMSNLVGRVEQMPQMGALVTNFNLIKPGDLHLANGGYLLLDARRLLTEPMAWDALKRALQSREIKIEAPGQFLSLVSTISLEPDPIPLDIKVFLIGDRQFYYLLMEFDPDFLNLFKVAADFDDTLDWTREAAELFAPAIATICQSESLKHVSADGVARLIEQAARIADDAKKLSLRIGLLADVVREASFWAGRNGHALITRDDIDHTLIQQIERRDRLRERAHESILRDVVLIDTEGSETGQINGLSVLSIGELVFGRPTRITANVRMGSGRVIDIEREVELGGPLHSKGVFILAGFISERFALNVPLSLSASLVFEQSYGGVDGDSASSAELYALLSALADVPIRQSLAVTGSVNQKGDVQPIGGVNEKIEGFYDICAARGLTGEQGVLIPAANVQHLMLRKDVVQSCADGRFHVYAVSTIAEGIELLTGVPAGERGQKGKDPEGGIFRMAEDKLLSYAATRKSFGSAAGGASKSGDA